MVKSTSHFINVSIQVVTVSGFNMPAVSYLRWAVGSIYRGCIQHQDSIDNDCALHSLNGTNISRTEERLLGFLCSSSSFCVLLHRPPFSLFFGFIIT